MENWEEKRQKTKMKLGWEGLGRIGGFWGFSHTPTRLQQHSVLPSSGGAESHTGPCGEFPSWGKKNLKFKKREKKEMPMSILKGGVLRVGPGRLRSALWARSPALPPPSNAPFLQIFESNPIWNNSAHASSMRIFSLPAEPCLQMNCLPRCCTPAPPFPAHPPHSRFCSPSGPPQEPRVLHRKRDEQTTFVSFVISICCVCLARSLGLLWSTVYQLI